MKTNANIVMPNLFYPINLDLLNGPVFLQVLELGALEVIRFTNCVR